MVISTVFTVSRVKSDPRTNRNNEQIYEIEINIKIEKKTHIFRFVRTFVLGEREKTV